MLAALAGSVSALIVGGVAFLFAKTAVHFRGWARDIPLVAAVIGCVLAGVLFVGVGLGVYVARVLAWVRAHGGVTATAVIALICLAILLAVGRVVVKRAEERAMWKSVEATMGIAFLLPVLGSYASTGVFHTLNTALVPLADMVNSQLQSLLGI